MYGEYYIELIIVTATNIYLVLCARHYLNSLAVLIHAIITTIRGGYCSLHFIDETAEAQES